MLATTNFRILNRQYNSKTDKAQYYANYCKSYNLKHLLFLFMKEVYNFWGLLCILFMILTIIVESITSLIHTNTYKDI